MPPSPSPKKIGFFTKILSIFGSMIGALIGMYTGLNLLVPLGGALLFGWIAHKILSPSRKPIVPAFAVQAGHLLWMIVGAIYLDKLDGWVIDVVVMTIGLTWLLLRPSLGSVIFLSIFQGVSFFANLYLFLLADFGTLEHKALLLHLSLRVTAILLMFSGLKNIRASRSSLIKNNQQ